jgi:hypothetical protein
MRGYMYRLFLVVPSQRLPIVFLFGFNTCGLDTERTGKARNVNQCLPRLSRADLIVSYRFLHLRELIVLDNERRIQGFFCTLYLLDLQHIVGSGLVNSGLEHNPQCRR